MPYDLGFNFRANAGYVTDGAEGVPVFGATHQFPTTYTAGNGYSVNAGFVSTGAPVGQDRDSANDPRIAGINYVSNDSTGVVFKVDLSSGSAPGAGDYTVDLAVGDAIGGSTHFFQLLDDATLLIDGTNGGSGITTTTGHYIDATLADVAATTTWTGSTASKTFATTTANFKLGNGAGGALSRIAHLRLTLQATGGVHRLLLLGVGT